MSLVAVVGKRAPSVRALFPFVKSTRRDSNSQPSALKTAALPIELQVLGGAASFDPDRPMEPPPALTLTGAWLRPWPPP